jgi:hypothetical protein
MRPLKNVTGTSQSIIVGLLSATQKYSIFTIDLNKSLKPN